jgi:hypothetical protein
LSRHCWVDLRHFSNDLSIAEQNRPLLKTKVVDAATSLDSQQFKTSTLNIMQNLRNLTLFVLLLMGTLGLRAQNGNGGQNGNVVVASIDIQDLGNGTGMIVVKLSGNQASNYDGGTFTITGDRIANGSASSGIGAGSRVFIDPPVPGNGNSNGNQQVLLAGVFPIRSGAGSDEVTMQFNFRDRTVGLDWTYSRVGRLPRRTDI